MKVKVTRRPMIIILGVLAVAAVTSLAVWNRPQPKREFVAESTTNGTPTSEPAAELGVSAETQGDRVNGEGQADPSKRIVHVPDTRSESEVTGELEPSEYIGANAAEFATEVIEKGLAGDVVMAGYVRDLAQVCETWVPVDAEAFENLVGMAMALVNYSAGSGDPVPGAGTPWLRSAGFSDGPAIWVFPLEHQVRAHIAEWQRGCKDAAAILNDDLRRELELLARDGHVMARYLYAMWRPDATLSEQALERSLQWQMNATEFSYANIADGEPIGYLAFGQSYFEALFTPQNSRLALLMLNAAYQCGYENLKIMDFVKRFGGESDNPFQLVNVVQLTRERFDELTAQLTRGCR